MKQFSLEEYLKNPNRKIITRNGRSARIICTDRNWIDTKHIIALVTMENGVEVTKSYNKSGKAVFETDYGPNDLFFAPNKKEGWVNMYKIRSGEAKIDQIYNSKEEAEAGRKDANYILTAKIEWEE